MKKTILMMIAVIMLFSMTACGQTPERDRDRDDDKDDEGVSWSEALFAKDETDAKTSEDDTTDAPKEEPAPETTMSPAQTFAKERGLTLPDIDAEFITDIEEVVNLITAKEVWSLVGAEDDDEFGDLFLEWFAKDGTYTQYNDFLGDLYIGGVWRIEGEKLVIETMDGTTDSVYPVYAKTEDEEILYLYYGEFPAKYYPGTNEEKVLITMDSQLVANIRYYLCSASWELRGKYDEAGNFKEQSPTRVYTFLADGQMVLREEGKYIKGRYTLNSDWLTYSLENGERYANTYYTDDTTGISYIFLYPDENSTASDVYWAVSRRNVSSVVEEGEAIQARRDIPYWTVTINGEEVDSFELYDNLEIKSWQHTLMSNGEETSVTGYGYTFDDIAKYLGITEYEDVTVVYEAGYERFIPGIAAEAASSMLVVKNDDGYLLVPLASALTVLPDERIKEIVIK